MKKISKRRLAKGIVMAFLAAGVQSAAHAVDGDQLEIHGYGYQSYLQTSDNTYLGADAQGDMHQYLASMVMTATLDEKSKVWVQFMGTESGVALDWAYVDYQVTPSLAARGGKIRLPIGLYNEARDVGYLQLATLLPTMYQVEQGYVTEAYRGAGLLYTQGGLSLDVYAGQLATEDDHAIVDPAKVNDKRMFGMRVAYKPGIEGLTLMGSAYTSRVNTLATISKREVAVLSVDYTNNAYDLKAEYAKKSLFNIDSSSYYAQAGYTFDEKWTPFVRYENTTTDKTRSSDPSFYQKTTSLGVAYKVSNNIGLRLENHWNNGYALPVASDEVAAGAGVTDWNMLGLSVNFIF